MLWRLIITIFWFSLAFSTRKRNFAVVMDKVQVRHTVPKVIKHLHAWIENRNNRTYMSGYFQLKTPLAQMDIRTQLTVSRKSFKQLMLYDVLVDGCQLFKLVDSNTLFKKILSLITASLDVLPSCPLKTDFNYTIRDYTVSEEVVPSFTPEGKYRATNIFYYNNTEAAFLILEGRVIYRKDGKRN